MSLNYVSNPYAYYNARNKGRPIFNGKIFVGEPDLDPTIVANQKPLTAKQEDGTQVSIAQPVSTNSGGYAVDASGNVVVLLVEGNYSIRVNDAQGALALEQSNVNNGVPITSSDNPVLYRDTISTMIADTGLEIGQLVITKGGSSPGDGGASTYLIAANQSVDGIGDFNLDNGNVALLQSHISVQTSTGTSEAALGCVIGDATYSPSVIGEGSVLIGGYEEANKNRLPGTTELRAIIAGYDCEIAERGVSDDGGLACVIVGSHHSEIQGDATHGLIAGGSNLAMTDGDYGVMIGGTGNEVRNNNGRPTHSAIIGGFGNVVDSPNAAIVGGITSTVAGEFSAVLVGQNSQAAGNFVIVMGSENQSLAGTLANGSKNTISGGRTNLIDSITNPVGNVIAGGENHSVYGLYCSVGGGIGAKIGDAAVNSSYGTIPGGLNNTVTAETAGSVLGGRLNQSAADYSTVTGGRENVASGIYSEAKGYQADARLDAFDTMAHGFIATVGDAQTSRGTRKAQTTDGTATPTPSLVMQDNSTWRFECVVVAHKVGGTPASASFKIVGLVRRDVGVGTVAFVGVPTVTNEFADATAATWTATVITNISAGAIRAELTGEAGKTINWETYWTLVETVG